MSWSRGLLRILVEVFWPLFRDHVWPHIRDRVIELFDKFVDEVKAQIEA